MLAWSPGTAGTGRGRRDRAARRGRQRGVRCLAARGARQIRGLDRRPSRSCRAPESWEQLARPESVTRWKAERDAAARPRSAAARMKYGRNAVARLEGGGRRGHPRDALVRRAGASTRSSTRRPGPIPHVQLSCEDYGLVYRLAANRQGPRLRLDATLGRPGRGAGLQRRRRAQGHREAERIRGALRAPRFLGRRLGRHRQRHRHGDDAGGDAPPQAGVSQSEAHDRRGPLGRRGAGPHRLAARSPRTTPRSSRVCRRRSTRTTAPGASSTSG